MLKTIQNNRVPTSALHRGADKTKLSMISAMKVKEMKDGHAIVADLTKKEDMKRAIEEAIAKMGGLDILVNR